MDSQWREGLDKDLEILFPVPEVTHPLFHYTDSRGFLGIVTRRRIWATDYRFLNDTEEFVIGERTIEAVAKEMAAEEARSTTSKQLLNHFIGFYETTRLSRLPNFFCYVASFSESGDMLSQWRAYSSLGSGFSLGFSWLPAPGAQPIVTARPGETPAGLGVALIKCVYDEKTYRAKVREHLELVLERTVHWALEAKEAGADTEELNREFPRSFVVHAHRHAGTIAPLLKHKAFEEEHEWRLIAMPKEEDLLNTIEFRPSSRGVVPYVEIPLKNPHSPLPMELAAVYVGPTLHPEHTKIATKTLLLKNGLPDVDVQASIAPYRP